MKYTLISVLFLLSLIGCNKSSSDIEEAINESSTYSTSNTHDWVSGEISFESLHGEGECSISNGKVFYKKTDSSIGDVDYCFKIGEAPDFCTNSVEVYEINFSDDEPTLIATMSAQCV